MDDESNAKETWFLNSGFSHHIIGDRDFFVTLDEKFFTQGELGNGKNVKIEG